MYIYIACAYIYIYIYITEIRCDTLPLTFCETQWIEDECVAEIGIHLWGNIVPIIKCW